MPAPLDRSSVGMEEYRVAALMYDRDFLEERCGPLVGSREATYR